jgi:hypothetical protein
VAAPLCGAATESKDPYCFPHSIRSLAVFLARGFSHRASIKAKRPRERGLLFPNQTFLRGRTFHILIRCSLKLLPAILRTEKIFLSRELRMEFGSLIVNFHSTDRVRNHDSSIVEFISAITSFGFLAKTLPFPAIFKTLICFTLPDREFSWGEHLRKFFQSREP